MIRIIPLAFLLLAAPLLAQEVKKYKITINGQTVIAEVQEIPPEPAPVAPRVVVDGHRVMVDGKLWAEFITGTITGGDRLTVTVTQEEAKKHWYTVASIQWGDDMANNAGKVTFPIPDSPAYFYLQSKQFGTVCFVGPCAVAAGNFSALQPRFPDREPSVRFEVHFVDSLDDTRPLAYEIERFRTRYPMRLEWPDRRPVGKTFPAGRFPDGRRWVFQPSAAPLSQAEFERGMLAHIDSCIANCKAVDAQGLIVWNIEGEHQPHPISYIGDPEKHETFAPEVNRALASEVFRKITAAGLLAGVTVRPNEIVKVGDQWQQQQLPDALYQKNLRRKIRFARDQWGCRLFYIDTIIRTDPGDWIQMPPFELIAELATEFPDCLLIPEQSNPNWMSVTCLFSGGVAPLPVDLKRIYPDAFSFLFGQNTDWTDPESKRLLQRSIAEGNVPTFNAWYESPEVRALKDIQTAD